MYTLLDTNKTNKLYLVRHGWLSPEYELTDHTYNYGKMSYSGLSRRSALVETAAGMWTFRLKELFSRTILIIDRNGEVVAEITRDWFSRTRALTLNDDFRAKFYRPSIWSRQYIWEANSYGEIMHIESNILTLKFFVSIGKSTAPASLIPLLIFIGAHLIILRRRRKAAH